MTNCAPRENSPEPPRDSLLRTAPRWDWQPGSLTGKPAQLGPEAKYGLGVIIRPTAHGISYGHSGFFPGYVTEMMYFPQYKFAVAVQVNTSVSRATGKSLVAFITDFADIIVKSGAK